MSGPASITSDHEFTTIIFNPNAKTPIAVTAILVLLKALNQSLNLVDGPQLFIDLVV